MGTGVSIYVKGDEVVADGKDEPATIEAFDLGYCKGRYMYQAVEWWHPQYGQRFNPSQYINICTGAYVGMGS